MSDPKRWTDDAGDGTAFERELFRAGQAVGLAAEEKRRQWLAIAAQAALLPAASAPAAHALAGKAAAKGFAGSGWLKALTLVPVLAGAGAGVYALSRPDTEGVTSPRTTHAEARAPVHEAPQVVGPSHDEPAAPSPEAPVVKSTQAPARARDRAAAVTPLPAAAAPVAAAAAASAEFAETADDVRARSHLAEEARAVLEARNALRSNNPSAALRVLDDARVRFPSGSLGQEREALTIEGLARVGRTDVARTCARAFLTRFPNSPLASNVRRFE